MSSVIFALDIGTRSVVGTILQEIDERHHVLDLISIEHNERAMIDGQIHNIADVVKVIKEIKNKLEEKHGPLKKVSVAAAGRALITEESILALNLIENPISSKEEIHRLELAAVQQAHQNLLSKNKNKEDDVYYCVGYSVLHYTLDGQKIGNLIDQTGSTAEVHVIATFLPQVVVESLLTALQQAELEMTALTLEPIAAIQVLVPPSMRKLNIALVDIGAGTSDIAIADDNTITAYGMVPMAGDEVTDALSQAYLVDFPVAEKVKRQLSSQETIKIEDILGFTQQFQVDDVCAEIEKTIDKIAQAITSEIMRLNRDQAPQAVVLVGGGSLTPNLSKKLGQTLNLPEMRVGIRGLEALHNVIISPKFGQSPELVTPIGIAIAAQNAPLHYMTVTVNGKNVRLFELNDVTVGDALITSNLPIDEMIGRPGRGITITLNGQTMALPGQMGRSATVHINDELVTMKHPIKDGDSIKIQGGKNGTNATPMLKDVVNNISSIQVIINNKPISLKPRCWINGKQGDFNTIIQDRDIVRIENNNTLEDILSTQAFSQKAERFTILLDGKPMRFKKWETQYYVGEKMIQPSYKLQDGDQITVKAPILPTMQEIFQELEMPFFQRITVYFNEEAVQIDKPLYQIQRNGEITRHHAQVKQGDQIEFQSLPNNSIIFSDVFSFINYEPPKNITGSYNLLRNGSPIRLNDEIFQNDRLEIIFQLVDS